jgi:hypothetical protein
MSKWHPISTAPKTGERLLLFAAGTVTIGAWCAVCVGKPGGEWRSFEREQPTHWMKLPKPPKTKP